MIQQQQPPPSKRLSSVSQMSSSTQDYDALSGVATPSVRIGVKPLPLTAALVKSDHALVEGLCSVGYDCVLLPLTNARYKENCAQYFKQFKDTQPAEGAPNLNLLQVPPPEINQINVLTGPHSSHTIGLLSSWIELDNADSMINEFSTQVLANEVSYAQYIGITTLLLAPPKDLKNLQIYTDNLNTILNRFPRVQLSISLPMCEEPIVDPVTGDPIPMVDPMSTWDVWNSIRIQCDYNVNLSVSLGSPKNNVPQAVVERWILEPVRFYLLSSFRFIPNSKGYPVLSKFNQLIIWKFIQRMAIDPPVLLLHGIDKDNDINTRLHDSYISSSSSKSATNGSERSSIVIKVDGNQVSLGDSSYLEYLRYLVSVSSKHNQLLPFESFTINGYLRAGLRPDQLKSPQSLQTPLEPAVKDLDNNTYRIFEQDRSKYDAYDRAIVAALMDISSLPQFRHLKAANSYGNAAFNTSSVTLPGHSSEAKATSATNEKLHILVVGPGRGPLIERLFAAFKLLKLSLDNVHIVAIEKNTNVMIYLNQCNKDHWSNKVTIYQTDARRWQPTLPEERQGFNLVISELLGGFGCNELAPECLDGITPYCQPGCIFIPEEFSSYVAPAISPSLYSKISRATTEAPFDKPYLPLLDSYDVLSSKYAKVWTFRFPQSVNGGTFATRHNRRQAHATLKCHRQGVIHGLLGYFTATLYKNIQLSTCPTGNGPTPHNLVSWLPFFFPICQPIHITDEQEVSIFIKRESSDGRVWYEWSLESFLYLMAPDKRDDSQFRVRTGVTRIHNPGGTHYSALF